MQNSTPLRSAIPLVLIGLLFFFLGLLRLNDVSVYTPDSVRYMIWGNSIAHGKGFIDDTQPVPDRFVLNAPLYAVLTAPVHLFFPMSISAVKVYTLCWGILAIAFLYFWILEVYGRLAAMIAAGIVALNPAMLFVSTEVLSEAPFIALLLFCLLMTQKLVNAGEHERKYFALLAICVSFLPLLREVGFAMVAALALHFGSKRQFGKALMIVLPAMLLLGLWHIRNMAWIQPETGSPAGNISIMSQHFATPESSSMVVEYALRVWLSLKSYAIYLTGMIFYPIWSTDFATVLVHRSQLYTSIGTLLTQGKYIIGFLTTVLLGAGFITSFRRSPTAIMLASFSGAYLLIVCLYPVHDARFLLPLLPLLIYYVFGGASWICSRWSVPDNIQRVASIAAAAGLVLLPSAIGLGEMISVNLEYRRSPEKFLQYPGVPLIYRFQWSALGEWMDSHLSDSTVIASPIKDIVLVAGNRRVLELDPGITLPTFETLLRNFHVEYVLATARWSDLRDFEFVMRESRRFWFEPVREAPNIMRVHSRLRDPANAINPHANFDTSKTSELLRAGRAEIVRGAYQSAIALLRRASDRVPNQPEIVYQSMVASLMAEDSSSAAASLHQLLGLTQTMSWTSMSRLHFDALQLVIQAKRSETHEQRALLLQKAASLYWQIGYPRRAAELLEPLLADEPGYFAGLLWGFHFHLQNGDTMNARRYLAKLERLDGTNVLVQSDKKLIAVGDSLSIAGNDSARSALHSVLAAQYAEIGLDEEALDECERSLRYEPANIDALLLMGKLFERKERPEGARRAYRQILKARPGFREAVLRADSLDRVLSGK